MPGIGEACQCMLCLRSLSSHAYGVGCICDGWCPFEPICCLYVSLLGWMLTVGTTEDMGPWLEEERSSPAPLIEAASGPKLSWGKSLPDAHKHMACRAELCKCFTGVEETMSSLLILCYVFSSRL